MIRNYLVLLILITLSIECMASGMGDAFKITPVILDSENDNGSVLGLKYVLSNRIDFSNGKSGSHVDNSDGPVNLQDIDEIYGKTGFYKYSVEGIWTVDEMNNPLSTSHAKIEGGYGDFQNGYEFWLSGIAGLEGNQDYSNRNEVYGLKAGGHYSFDKLNRGTFIDLSIMYEQVDASEDDERMSITDDDEFDRLSSELQINYKIKNLGASDTSITSLQFNYRYYSEIDAPALVKTNNMDVHALKTYMIKFNKGLYIAYSTGSLPFDKQDDQVLEIGFSHSLF